MSEEVALYEPNHDLAISRAPEMVLTEAKKAASALADVVSKKKKPVIFNGEQYLEFEDWQTVGRFYGVTAKITQTEFVDFGGVVGFQARAVAIRPDGMEISAAEAMCLNDEPNWSKKPLFQLRSMAQTRACAKALRNVLAWVVVLAGYRATPAEEIQDIANGSKPPISEPKAKTETKKEGNTVTGIIEKVSTKTGTGKKGDWTKYGILIDGEWYGTFDKNIGEQAEISTGKEVTITFSSDGKYKTCESLSPSEEREPGADG